MAAVQCSFVRHWCVAVPAAVSRHNSLQAVKASHPAPAVGEAGAHICLAGSPGVGAQQSQPQALAWLQRTTCSTIFQPLVLPCSCPLYLLCSPQLRASSSLQVSSEPLGRGQHTSHNSPVMCYFASFSCRDVSLDSRRMRTVVRCPLGHRGAGGLLSAPPGKHSLESCHGHLLLQTTQDKSAAGKRLPVPHPGLLCDLWACWGASKQSLGPHHEYDAGPLMFSPSWLVTAARIHGCPSQDLGSKQLVVPGARRHSWSMSHLVPSAGKVLSGSGQLLLPSSPQHQPSTVHLQWKALRFKRSWSCPVHSHHLGMPTPYCSGECCWTVVGPGDSNPVSIVLNPILHQISSEGSSCGIWRRWAEDGVWDQWHPGHSWLWSPGHISRCHISLCCVTHPSCCSMQS